MSYTYKVIKGQARFKRLTDEGLALFKSMWAAHAPYEEIEETLGICEHLVKRYKAELGLSSRDSYRYWTTDQLRFLADNWGELTPEELGQKLGRTPSACGKRASLCKFTDPRASWTEEAKEKLRKLKAEGLSYEACAIRLGVTKNAAIGQGFRLGIPKVERAKQTPAQKLARKTFKQRERRHGRQFRITLSRKREKAGAFNAPVDAPPPLNLSLIENDGCMWPTEKGFCGHPKAGHKHRPHYCEHHARA